MKLTFDSPDERETMKLLCADLATKVSPLYKNAHTILRGALEGAGPLTPTNENRVMRGALERLRDYPNPGLGMSREYIRVMKEIARVALNEAASSGRPTREQIIEFGLSDAPQPNPNAGVTQAFPKGRW